MVLSRLKDPQQDDEGPQYALLPKQAAMALLAVTGHTALTPSTPRTAPESCSQGRHTTTLSAPLFFHVILTITKHQDQRHRAIQHPWHPATVQLQ